MEGVNMRYKVDRKRFEKAILNSGLPIIKIAQNSNVSRPTIYKLLKEDISVNGYIISRISKVLNVNIEDLIEE